MQYIGVIVRTLVLVAFVTTGWYLAFTYVPIAPDFSPPFHVWLGDTLILIIHEAGHFFFRPLGDTLYFMGGTIFQVLFPLAAAVVVWMRWREQTIYPLFLAGWALVNGAVYISDAPFRLLHLIGRGTLHDWHHILVNHNMLDDALIIGAWVHAAGVVVMAVAVGMGGWFVVRDFRILRA